MKKRLKIFIVLLIVLTIFILGIISVFGVGALRQVVQVSTLGFSGRSNHGNVGCAPATEISRVEHETTEVKNGEYVVQHYDTVCYMTCCRYDHRNYCGTTCYIG